MLMWNDMKSANEYMRKWVSDKRKNDPEWVEKNRAYQRKWRKKQYAINRDKELEKNKTPEVRAYKAKWAREQRLKDPDTIREYKNSWVRARRRAWIKANGPCIKCGSTKRLEVDHINPLTKISHSVWSWSEARKNKELSKCQVLCFICHRLKTNQERGWSMHGELNYQLGCRCQECIRVHKKKLRAKKRSLCQNS